MITITQPDIQYLAGNIDHVLRRGPCRVVIFKLKCREGGRYVSIEVRAFQAEKEQLLQKRCHGQKLIML